MVDRTGDMLTPLAQPRRTIAAPFTTFGVTSIARRGFLTH